MSLSLSLSPTQIDLHIEKKKKLPMVPVVTNWSIHWVTHLLNDLTPILPPFGAQFMVHDIESRKEGGGIYEWMNEWMNRWMFCCMNHDHDGNVNLYWTIAYNEALNVNEHKIQLWTKMEFFSAIANPNASLSFIWPFSWSFSLTLVSYSI